MKKAIICDIDGTLALLEGRNPYNPKTVEHDLLNYPIANILNVYSKQNIIDVQIILVSGRYEKFKEQTNRWLKKHKIENYLLYMRPDNDRRKDVILKKEIYLNNIKGKFEVLFVLDDRDQVVRMWRKDLGLTCLQVEYGDF